MFILWRASPAVSQPVFEWSSARLKSDIKSSLWKDNIIFDSFLKINLIKIEVTYLIKIIRIAQGVGFRVIFPQVIKIFFCFNEQSVSLLISWNNLWKYSFLASLEVLHFLKSTIPEAAFLFETDHLGLSQHFGQNFHHPHWEDSR